MLKDKPFYFRLIVLGLLILTGMLLFSAIAILSLVPFLGSGFLDRLQDLSDLDDTQTLQILKYLQVMNQAGLFIAPSLVFAWLYNRQTSTFLGSGRMPKGSVLLFSVMLTGAMIPAINLMVEWNESIRLPEFFSGMEQWMEEKEGQANNLTEAFLNTASFQGFLVNFLMIGVLAALGEELFFRGLLIRILLDQTPNKHFAVWITSFLFSALHLQFYGFFPRMLLGLVFGYVFVWTENLWYPVAMHLVFNSITVVVAYLNAKGSISTDVESFGSFSEPWVIMGSVFISIFLFLLIYRKGMNNKKPPVSIKPR
ncbi:MAG: CPBP family intramembrane metalloprotease [Bacteroidales bacterium]|nr:CPBP family intramembrane metalloprotease [Bacteroidales bacterium]